MENIQVMVFTAIAILLAFYIVRWRASPLYSIPTVGGPSAPLLSYLTTFNFFLHGRDIISEGYQKFYGSTFKVPLFDQWLVVVSGPKMIDELTRRPDDELSFTEGAEDTMYMKYTVGHETTDDLYHVDIIKEKLTRTLPVVLPDVIDELKLAVHEHIPAQGDDWLSLNAMRTMQQIVARASNRAFVGLPVCRDQGFLDLAIRFTIDVMKDKWVLTVVPKILKPLIGPIISKSKKTMYEALPHLKLVIDERMARTSESHDWTDKPNDMLQWLIDEATVRKTSDIGLIGRIMVVNFAAIHTSSNSITHVLYDLAANPEYIQPLRDEIEPIVAAEGWTKAAMGKMWKLDSLVKESQRYNGIGLTSLTRKAMKDITFNDGTFIPKGTLLVAAAHPTHHDEINYANPQTFDPFRFARMREAEGEGTKHQFVNTSVEYISFGHGKHACPGRFFAANQLKAILAYILLNYDMKFGSDGKRPANMCFQMSLVPAVDAEVMFRKRQYEL